jgi:hypothetical protein
MAGTEATVTTGLCWSLVNCGIVLLFFGISILCHQAIKDFKMICTVVLLAPQILVIIILGDQSVAIKATVVMGLCWSLFSEVIVVFVVIATLYREAMKNSKLTCAVPLVLLAPEICITISFGLVVLGQLNGAIFFSQHLSITQIGREGKPAQVRLHHEEFLLL